MTTLREAARQALEALKNNAGEMRVEGAISILETALAQQAEPDLSRCPQCDGPADNGFDRSIPPNPYLCTKCIAEPVEPVAWMVYTEGGASAYVTDNPRDLIGAYKALPLYTAPPQRLPLTEEPVAPLIAQRDALLEALRALLSYANVLEMRLLDADGEHRAMQKARAAIALVEGRVKAVEENT